MPIDAGPVRTLARAVLPPSVRGWIGLRRQAWHDARVFRRHVRATDVFIVGHPKSGNTWLAYMVAILFRQDRRGEVTLKNVGAYIPIMHNDDGAIAKHGHLPDPRFFRNEMPLYARFYPRVIYLMRDPRAVLVSYYQMYRTMFGDTALSFQAFLEVYLAHGCIPDWEPLVRWDRQVIAWTQRAERDPRVMVVRYEEMVRDRRASLEAIARFAGVPYRDEDLEVAVARGSFEAMRQNEQAHGAESYTSEQGERGRFVRQGKVDGWRNELDPELVEQIEKAFAQAMRKMGYQ